MADDLDSYINSTTTSIPIHRARTYVTDRSSVSPPRVRLQEDYETAKKRTKTTTTKKKKSKSSKRRRRVRDTGKPGNNGLTIIDEDDAVWDAPRGKVEFVSEFAEEDEAVSDSMTAQRREEDEEEQPVVVGMDEDIRRELARGHNRLRMDGDTMRIVAENRSQAGGRGGATLATLRKRVMVTQQRRQRHDSDDDNSDSDLSPPRRRRRQRHDSDDDDDSDSDLSPPRRRRQRHDSDDDDDDDSDSDLSPPRRRRQSLSPDPTKSERRRDSDDRFREEYAESVVKERIVSGLKTAQDMRLELAQKQLETQQSFERMRPELSGRNADTVFRDARTGRRVSSGEEYVRAKEKERKRREREMRKRDREARRRKEEEEEEEEADRESSDEDDKEREETVIRRQDEMEWGSGLVQRQQSNSFREQLLKEMEMPFARYEDDTELEEMRKKELREGDPMAAYIMREQQKEQRKQALAQSGGGGVTTAAAAAGQVEHKRRMYVGSFPHNRYGIRPGWRWDGRDRSNKFEERLIKQQSQAAAAERDSYQFEVGGW